MKTLLSKSLENTTLVLGFIAPLLFIVADLTAGMVKKNYSFVSQSISELSAVGSSTRPFLVTVNIVGYLLILVFSLGVWKLAEENWALRLIAAFLILFGIINLIWLFFPMHVGQAPSKTNVIIGAIGVFVLTFAILFGSFAFNGWFRVLSISIITFFVLATIFGLWIAPRFTASSAPTIGIQERGMMYIFLIWLIALASKLIQTKII